MTDYPKSRKDGLVVQHLEDETLVYDMENNKALCLNHTSALVWEMCDGATPPLQIADRISIKLKTIVTEEMALLALDELGKRGLLEAGDRYELSRLGRREAIKKAGLASMAALPLISAIIAPRAAAAQSGGIALLGACPTQGGPGCAPGLNCNFCLPASGGQPCPSPNHCCVGVGGFFTPGTVFGNCFPANTDCFSANASSACCSGTATFSVTGCNGPGTGRCTCV